MGCPKMVLKGNLSEMMSNWQTSIGYEDNQIMTTDWAPGVDCLRPGAGLCRLGTSGNRGLRNRFRRE